MCEKHFPAHTPACCRHGEAPTAPNTGSSERSAIEGLGSRRDVTGYSTHVSSTSVLSQTEKKKKDKQPIKTRRRPWRWLPKDSDRVKRGAKSAVRYTRNDFLPPIPHCRKMATGPLRRSLQIHRLRDFLKYAQIKDCKRLIESHLRQQRLPEPLHGQLPAASGLEAGLSVQQQPAAPPEHFGGEQQKR